MNVGTFAFILNMERDGKPVTDIYALGNYSRVEPARALALAVLLFSLAGVPPLVGFFGKFYVLKAAVDAGLVWLAVAGVVASVIGAFYYIRIVYLMYFGEASEPLDGRMPMLHWALLAVCAIAMVAGVVNLFGIETLAASAAATLVQSAHDLLAGRGRPRYPRRDRQHQRGGAAPGGRRRGGAGLDLRAPADRGARAAGRSWAMGQGNFAASLPDAAAGDGRGGLGAAVVRGGARASRRAGGGDRAAGALWAEVAERRAPRRRQGRGVLLETSGPAGGRRRWSSGSGSNLATAPERGAGGGGGGAGEPARATGIAVGAEDFLDLLAPADGRLEERLQRRGLRADPRRLAGAGDPRRREITAGFRAGR